MKIEDYSHNVGTCYRCDTTVEPMHFRAVVCFHEAAGRSRPLRRSKTGKIKFVPERLCQDLLQLDGKYPRLVHFPPALVGAPHPGLLLRRLAARWSFREEDAGHLPQVRRAPCGRMRTCWIPGSPPALWPFSTLGWPDKTEGSEIFLPHRRAGDGLRHHLLLGSADDRLRHRELWGKCPSNMSIFTALCAMLRAAR